MTPSLLNVLLVCAVVICIALATAWALRRGRELAQMHDAVLRLEARLAEQGKHAQLHAHFADGRMHDLDTALREVQAETRHVLERRFGELQTRQMQIAGHLRTHLFRRFELLQRETTTHLSEGRTQTVRALGELRARLENTLGTHQTRLEQRQGEALKTTQDTLHSGMRSVQLQVADALTRSAAELGKRVDGLTQSTDRRLKEISGEVEKRLSEGFEKTTATFADVLKRLALIDEAQKRITELSSNVVSLQEVLSDKRSRGALGEVQLNALVRNVMPEAHFAVQHTLSNGKIVDCMLFLPEPTGNVSIDAKFPLESYQRLSDHSAGDVARARAERQFKQDIRKHIRDISEKYIVPGETAHGAVMFIPAEAVFAEIQAHHPDLVQHAHKSRVWMVSPTTLMAILNTARAVLKDEATRKQVHIIQEHLAGLAKDFDRFQSRMSNLARHIEQAHEDVDEVHVSARKITSRFDKIERVELEHEPSSALDTSPATGKGTG